MQLTLSALSPIHIGSGNKMEPFDYYFENEKVLVINHDACIDALFNDDPENVNKYAKWIEEITRRISKAEKEARDARFARDRRLSRDKNQIIAGLRRDFNIIDFTQSVLNKPELAKEFKRESIYHKYTAHCPARPRSVVQLKEAIKTGGELYIPGSSLKGAIRTALAYSVIRQLSQNESLELLNKQDKRGKGLLAIIEEIRKASQNAVIAIQKNQTSEHQRLIKELTFLRRKFEKRVGSEIEKFVFGCADKDDISNRKLDDPKFDILRLIRVSDTTKANAEMLISEMKSYTLDKIDQGMKDQPIDITEFIDTRSEFEFSIEVDSSLIRKLLFTAPRNGWIDFERKFVRLFGVSKDQVKSMNEGELESAVVNHILQAMQDFGNAQKSKELSWLQQFKQSARAIFEKYINEIPSGEAIGKIGFASGWFATTTGLAFAENPYLKYLLPDILYDFNLDLTIKDEKVLRNARPRYRDQERQLQLLERTPNAEKFPKSRRMTAEGRDASGFIGWFLVKKGKLNIESKKELADEKTSYKADDLTAGIEALKARFQK